MSRSLLHDKRGFPEALIVILVILVLAIVATLAVILFGLDEAAERYHKDKISKLGLEGILSKDKVFDARAEEYALLIDSSQDCWGDYLEINISLERIEAFAGSIDRAVPKFKLEEHYFQECSSVGLGFTIHFSTSHHILKFSEGNETEGWLSLEKLWIEKMVNETESGVVKIIKAEKKGDQSFVYSGQDMHTILFRYGNTLHNITIENEPVGMDGEESIMTEALLSYADQVIKKMDKIYKRDNKST
jgi:hypothetical protein